MSDILACVFEDCCAVTQSDGTPDPKGPFCALQATTQAGLCKITTSRGSVTTVYLPLGTIIPIAVRNVWTSVTAATGIVGFLASPYSGGMQ